MAKLGLETRGNLGGAGNEMEIAEDSAGHKIGRLATVAGLVLAETRREDLPIKPADGLPRDGGSATSGIDRDRDEPLPHDRPVDSWGKPMSSDELLKAGAGQTFTPPER